MNFKIGQIVVAIDVSKTPLHCGSGMYPCAICVSVEPFVLVSESGDMMWTQHNPDNFVAKGMADLAVIRTAMERYFGSKT